MERKDKEMEGSERMKDVKLAEPTGYTGFAVKATNLDTCDLKCFLYKDILAERKSIADEIKFYMECDDLTMLSGLSRLEKKLRDAK